MPSRTQSEPSRSVAGAAVLAGGASSRMGEPKAGAMLAGRPLIAYPIEAVRAAGLEPLLARYTAAAIPVLEAAVTSGGALREAMGDLDPLIVEEAELAGFGDPERMTSSVNDRAELAAAARLLAAGAKR